MSGGNITLIILGLLAIWAILIYNSFVKHKNQVEEGWSGIDVQLKRRHNLLPNLVETVKGYASHERDALREVTDMRTRASGSQTVADRAQNEGLLGRAIGKLFAVAEAYPDLKASASFQELQHSLNEIEDHIQLSRRYYNGTVRNLNTMVDQFPSLIIARLFNFTRAEFFELDSEQQRAVPVVKF